MSAYPETFRAYVVNRDGDRFERGLRSLVLADLPDGDVEIRVEWSSINFKDGLAATADGKVARAYPLVPGIDLAGTVIRSADPAVRSGAQVIAHGYDLGVSRHGGFGPECTGRPGPAAVEVASPNDQHSLDLSRLRCREGR